jgi:hypothetical protein
MCGHSACGEKPAYACRARCANSFGPPGFEVQANQPAVRILGRRLELAPAARGRHRGLALDSGMRGVEPRSLAMALDQLVEQRLRGLAPACPLAREPVVELRRGVDLETFQQLAAVQRGGLGQGGDVARLRQLAEARGVEIDRPLERDAVAIGREVLRERRGQPQQRGAQ